MYQQLPRFHTKETARADALARQFQALAKQVCESREDLKPDDVITAAKKAAHHWTIDIEGILGRAVACAKLGRKLPWEM